MKKVDIEKLTPNVKRTNDWKSAEFDYSLIYADSMLPPQFRMGREPLTNDEMIEALEYIIDKYPVFYPAILDLGGRLLSKNVDLAIKTLDTAFDICLKISKWDIIRKDYDVIFENFEKIYHYEFVIKYAFKILDKFPDKAELYDYISHGYNVLGENEKAIEYGIKAVELEPNNTYYLGNLGFIYLTDKHFEETEKYFKLSIKADKTNVFPKNNLADCKIMKEKNLSLKEYYLLPIDYKKIDTLNNDENFSDSDEYVLNNNSCKFYLFYSFLNQQNQFKVHNFHSLLSTLQIFFGFVKSVSNDTFVWENIDFFSEYFKAIMHKFIFKHGDVDVQIMNEIFDSTNLFYNFLADNNVIKKTQFKMFDKKVKSLKNELLDKMHRYNEIRHNSKVSESKKEKIRQELFDGDHEWPFID